MDTNSSGEDLLVKARKPYTITKQREKWTEEEHNKFLEALKLHGRAWQRIEEHIGTKTAVQIRSHAQKFFTKLEKEAVTKGVPFGHAHDIEIPPPRPKRKPNNPYPRKIGALEEKTAEDKPSKSPSPLSGTVNIDNYAAWKIQRPKDASDDNSCSEVLNLLHNVPAASISSLNKKFNRFRPPDQEKKECSDTSNPSQITIGLNNKENTNKSDTVNACKGNEGEPNEQAVPKQMDKASTSNPGYTKNAPIDFMKKNEDKDVGMNTTSGISSVHHPSFPGFPPFTQFPANPEAYRSFFNISSTLSSLIVSTLLQHPAVHAAATVAASYWPSINADASTASSSETSQMNPTPSMAAIAAATVAAASAWWATQGLLPLYSPVNTGFAYVPPPMTTGPVVDTCQAPVSTGEEKVNNPEQSEARIAQSSSSDTDKSPIDEINDASYKNNLNNDNDNLISKKKVDRSSCGSNTPSSSEVETDANLIKQAGEKDENAPMNASNASLSDSNRRNKSSTGIMNESWKEVSEEGRIAFRALFSRGVLPQSFSPPQAAAAAAAEEESMTIPAHNDCVPTTTTKVPVDLNQKASSEPTDPYYIHAFSIPASAKNPSRKTGFKPYKRCSVEAKESRPNTNEENGNKRIRLEGEASI